MKRLSAGRLSASGMVMAGLALGLLSGCNSGPPPPRFADIRFVSQPPIELNVASVQVVEEYPAQLDAPHIEERLPVPLPHAAENWAHDRLKPVGPAGVALATITDASVLEARLPTEGGVSGSFTKQADTKYDATVAIRVEIKDEHGFTVRSANAVAQRSQTTIEGITPNDRDQILYQMETDLMTELDRQLETNIRSNFGAFSR
jgi:hypothetical protein